MFTDASEPDHYRPHLAAGTLWIAAADGGPVAFLAAHVDEDRLHIDELDVLRDHQRQGLGRRLLNAAKDWASSRGLRALSLTTFRNIPWNGPFYASLGFVEWDPNDAPPAIRKVLSHEAEIGLSDRCAMRLVLL